MSLARILYARLLLRFAVSGFEYAEAQHQLALARLDHATRLLERA